MDGYSTEVLSVGTWVGSGLRTAIPSVDAWETHWVSDRCAHWTGEKWMG